jgi:hypothetical protein
MNLPEEACHGPLALVDTAQLYYCAPRHGFGPGINERGLVVEIMWLDVAQGPYTQRQLVYDAIKARIYFRTKGHAVVRYADIGRFDLSCRPPVMMLDMARALRGDASVFFRPNDAKANGALVQQTLGRLGLPKQAIERLSAYPERLPCSL